MLSLHLDYKILKLLLILKLSYLTLGINNIININLLKNQINTLLEHITEKLLGYLN